MKVKVDLLTVLENVVSNRFLGSSIDFYLINVNRYLEVRIQIHCKTGKFWVCNLANNTRDVQKGLFGS